MARTALFSAMYSSTVLGNKHALAPLIAFDVNPSAILRPPSCSLKPLHSTGPSSQLNPFFHLWSLTLVLQFMLTPRAVVFTHSR